MTRTEHLRWAKDRALEYADLGDTANAVASMCSDLRKHPELENHGGVQLLMMMAAAGHLNSPAALRREIEGFN
jgi:hypothetical protein